MATDANVETAKTQASQSALERFLDSFLRESSIKWMLMIGAAIVACSSLMLVTEKWSSWPTSVKYLTILCYTAATYGIAEFCERRLKLQATSQVLKLLTLLLIPIGFMALSWLTGDDGGLTLANSALLFLLMIPATGFMYYASNEIFSHWLHGRQLTFLIAYMTLCLAGAMPVMSNVWLAVLFSSGFWLVMTLGVVKVNRRIFWLTEEHRWPRVFGFAPIALLGTMTVVLFISKANVAIPREWIGLALTLLAATVLMTARTIAEVFRQRTGDLVRPYPWPIIVPIFTGLLLITAGTLFSFHGFHFRGNTTYAVLPTAILAAALVMLTAKDTKQPAFVWLGMLLITLAFRAVPTLFHGMVEGLKATAATSLNEDKLPFAFYGISALPLLITFAIASRCLNDRKRFEFSVPLQHYVTIVSVILVAVSLTNIKAAFLVNAISAIAFVFYAITFRDRSYTLLCIGSLVISVATLVPFVSSVGLADWDQTFSVVALAAFGLITSSTSLFDRLAALIPKPERSTSSWLLDKAGKPRAWFQITGRATTLVIGSWWAACKAIQIDLPLASVDIFTVVLLATSGILWTIRSQNYFSGLWTWAIAAVIAWRWVVGLDTTADMVIANVTIATGVIAIIGYFALKLKKSLLATVEGANDLAKLRPVRSISRLSAVVLPLADLSLIHFAAFITVCFAPKLLLATYSLDLSMLPVGWTVVAGLMGLAAIIFRGPVSTSAWLLVSPVIAGLCMGTAVPSLFTHVNLVLIYTVTVAATTLAIRRFCQPANASTCSISIAWLSLSAVLGFVYIHPIVIASSSIAFIALYTFMRREMTSQLRTRFVIFSSLLSIFALTMLSGFDGWTAELPISGHFATASAFMITGLVLAILAFDTPWRSLDLSLLRHWSLTLRGLVLAMIVVSFTSNKLGSLHEWLIMLSMLIAAANEFRDAIIKQLESHVWAGLAVLGLLLVWMQVHHSMPLPPTVIRLLVVAAAGVGLALAKRWSDHPRLQVMCRSMSVVGLAVPLVSTLWSLSESSGNAAESLVIFAAATIWFVHGRSSEHRGYVVGSAMLLNVGIWSILNSLSLTDPQLYLVPLGLTVILLVEFLKSEIPATAHDPIRYAGALAILVTPCFEILGGSWLHMASLMVLSVVVILLAIGLRLRALIHAGTAFLLVDLIAMVVRSSIDHPGMLWVMGLLIGASVITLAAVCENNRERMLSRIRILSSELATWH